ncbi:hypothetical protein ASG63_08565 [Methylobacterium sp. Leaf94]|uniref:hypothetical protein n=1 Tax=Methylobacterium sp. Leaf94 TaxID=1736250 RepID=UPI0007141FDC|nr:hypothetical protein [Methylobacterium sp. Leaf94]KQU17554.1 hypothetical protein ASG63_08565 [Methylobacterium sp. Leaf94]
MQIRDLGDEAIDEILAEAIDGMDRRTGKAWRLELNGEHGDLSMSCGGKHVTTANVRPHIAPQDDRVPEAIRFRSALRRLVLEATQAVTPVLGAADIPSALARTFSAIAALDALKAKVGANEAIPLGHDLHRILDHLTGNDHSGCSTASSVSDFGRVVELGAGETHTLTKGFLITHADGSQRVRTPEGMAEPKRAVPLQADIDAVRDALQEAEACTDLDDGQGQGHIRDLRDTLDSLLADQRRVA